MTIHSPKDHALKFLDFELLKIAAGETASRKFDDYETVAVILEGSCAVSADGQEWKLARRSVFEEPASAVFVSPGTELSVTAQEATTLALCKARAKETFPATFIPRDQVKGEWRGKDGYRRRVFNIVNTETKTERIAVGETLNEPGEWSSFPSHKHDTPVAGDGKAVEVPLEEIYYFRVQPETGFGFQRLYAGDGAFDEAYVIRDGDVTRIPRGYHPVASMPGHRLYYLWMLAGDERTYVWNTDPKFRWME